MIRKTPRKTHLEKPLKAGFFKLQFSTLPALTAFVVVLALAIVAFTIGVHAWRVSYWPKFNQTEVISDILWMLIAGIIWIFLLGIVLAGVPSLMGGCLPGSFLQRNGKMEVDSKLATHTRLKFNFEQLTQLSVLWFLCLPALYYSNNAYFSVEQKGSVITGVCIAAFFLLAPLIRRERGRDENSSSSPDLKNLWSAKDQIVVKTRKFIVASLLSLPQIVVVSFFGFFSYNALGSLLPPFIALVADTEILIFGVVLVIAIANLCALEMAYGSTKVPFQFWFACVFGCGVFLFSISTSSLIELSRIGNVQNATMIYDRKFSGLVEKLLLSEDLGESVAVAKVDIVFSFGADVVVAKPKTFSSNSTCVFSWLSGESKKVASPPRVVPVPCLALPRSAVFSLT